MKTAGIIPAYNAADTVGAVAKKVKDMGFFCVVIDDGSTDDTYKNAAAAGVVVLKHEKNMGKGRALRTGFEYILKNDFDAAIMMDADGQHDPESLKDFVNAAELKNSAFIVGSRMHNTKAMPKIRVMTNKFMSWILSKKMGQYVPDTQSGYRFIRKDLLAKMTLSASRYEIESEMLIQAARLGAHIDSVPISSIYTGHKSHINPIVDALRFIRLMITLK